MTAFIRRTPSLLATLFLVASTSGAQVIDLTVNNVGIPLDAQGVPFTGIYSSFGAPGEALASQLDSFAIGHGLFSLLDAYPFQHPERPDLSVSIPLSERLFGQGADGTWKNFTVTIQPGLEAPFVP